MQDPTLQTILKNTYTTSDLYQRLDMIRECLEHELYDHEVDTAESLLHNAMGHAKEKGREDMARRFEEWGRDVFAAFTVDTMYDRMKELKEMAGKLPELVLYVPTPLSSEGKDLVGAWCRENLGETVMISLIIDSKAVGGCAFARNGSYHDFSLNYFLDKKQGEVAELIRNYDAE